MMKRFAAAIIVTKRTRTQFMEVMVTSDCHALALWAINKDEAVGIAMRTCYEVYPSKEGWEYHSCSAAEFPEGENCV